ncbi:MAG: FG-GAP-like repeat-containing protein [Planctomycetota bacterium]
MTRTRTVALTLLAFGVAGSCSAPTGPTVVGGQRHGSRLLAGAPEPWLDVALDVLRDQEYAFAPAGVAWSAVNRAHGLRAAADADGLVVRPRFDAAAPWSVRVSATALGRGGELPSARRLPPPQLIGDGDAVFLSRPGLEERCGNDGRGVELRLRLRERLPGDGPVWIDLELETELEPRLSPDRSRALFCEPDGSPQLACAELAATDASGDRLGARFTLDGTTLRMVLNDEAASYPIEVGPRFTSPAWQQEGPDPGGLFGFPLGSAGDLNGDGLGDVFFTASAEDVAAVDDAGRVHVFLGSPGGLSSSADWTIDGSDEARVYAAIGAGDVNGDGAADFCVLGRVRSGGGFVAQVGVWYGPLDLAAPASFEEVDWRATGSPIAAFGGPLAGLGIRFGGDLNGDGFGDLVVGNAAATGGNGELRIYLGGAGGLPELPSRTVPGRAGQGLGATLATADFDGDGRDELLVGSTLGGDGPFPRRLDLYSGAQDGLAAEPSWGYAAEPGWEIAYVDSFLSHRDPLRSLLVSVQSADGRDAAVLYFQGDYTGAARPLSSAPQHRFDRPPPASSMSPAGVFAPPVVAAAGDVNADGLEDFVVGFSQEYSGKRVFGAAHLFLAPARRARHLLPPRSFAFDRSDDGFATAAAGVGDVNGDGFDDVLVGALQSERGGGAFLYYGGSDEVAGPATWSGWPASDDFGADVSIVGDVNGDGFDDVAIGAPGFDAGGEGKGRVFVYHGSPEGPSIEPDFGWSAGEGTEGTGQAVAGPGDVNGDGFDDLLVGGTHVPAGVGRCTLLLGSAEGLSAMGSHIWLGDQLGYGEVVAGAGDVNGDGLADVLLGHPNYDGPARRSGKAELYLGKESGPVEPLPAWEASGTAPVELFGAAVASAGDGDGDALDDVVVGAPGFDGDAGEDVGRIVVFRGSPGGLLPAPAWELEGDAAGEGLGSELAAGDLNGDGRDDLVLGGPGRSRFTQVTWEPGTGGWSYLFSLGAGYEPSPRVFTLPGGVLTGSALAVLGDGDGDGRDELVVASPLLTQSFPGEGLVLVLRGIELPGEAPAVRWAKYGGAPHLGLGSALDAGGDVDGDGVPDLILGGHSAQGQVWFVSGAGL